MPQKTFTDMLAAAVAAANWHGKQQRKGAAREPYINHLLEVAALVSRATAGSDANLAIAALLHDAIEDQGVRRATIAACNGQHVSAGLRQIKKHDPRASKDARGSAPRKSG